MIGASRVNSVTGGSSEIIMVFPEAMDSSTLLVFKKIVSAAIIHPIKDAATIRIIFRLNLWR